MFDTPVILLRIIRCWSLLRLNGQVSGGTGMFTCNCTLNLCHYPIKPNYPANASHLIVDDSLKT